MATFSINVDLLVDVHTLVMNTLDGGASNAYLAFRDSSDVLLGTIPLTDPCGTVDSGTGQLTLSDLSSPNATTSGQADYAELCDSDDVVWITLPVVAGTTPVDDAVVISSTTIVAGYPIELVSATIG